MLPSQAFFNIPCVYLGTRQTFSSLIQVLYYIFLAIILSLSCSLDVCLFSLSPLLLLLAILSLTLRRVYKIATGWIKNGR